MPVPPRHVTSDVMCDGAAARVCVTVTEVSQHNTPRVASKVAMARRHVCV